MPSSRGATVGLVIWLLALMRAGPSCGGVAAEVDEGEGGGGGGGPRRIKVMSYNLQNWDDGRWPERANLVAREIKRVSADVVGAEVQTRPRLESTPGFKVRL